LARAAKTPPRQEASRRAGAPSPLRGGDARHGPRRAGAAPAASTDLKVATI